MIVGMTIYRTEISTEQFEGNAYEGYVDVIIYEMDTTYRAIGIGWNSEDKDSEGNFTRQFLQEARSWAAEWEE